MKTLMKIAAPLSLLAIAGCAAPFQAKVSRFQNLPAPQGQSFTIRTDNPRLQNSLEFSQYANIVADHLSQVGYTRAASPGAANLVVTVNYMVDNGRERIQSYPRAFGPFGGRFGYGGLGFGGWHRGYAGFGGGFGRGYYSGFYDPFLFDYRDIESYTIYTSELDMKIERPGSHERVFEGRAQAQATNNDLTTTVPNLIDAMFTNFPGNSGETVKITIAPPPKNRR